MNLGLLLKMLGVKVTPEQIAAIEAIIPQIPGKIQQTINVINAALQNFDARLRALEQNQLIILKQLEDIRDGGRNNSDDGGDIRPAGIGATERAIGGIGREFDIGSGYGSR